MTGTKLTADIAVIGGGGAGLTAATAALEARAKNIVVLEKAAKPGGNTAQSAGMFAVGSPAQKRKGIEVSVDESFREKMVYANWRVDPRIVRSCIEKSGEMVLARSVARYNSFCDAGKDADFLKEKKFLMPLRTPPFYAVLGRQGFDTTLGGIRINHRMEVLGRQDRPIRGLYATGDCASGWESANYNLRHPGCAMTFALCSGYIAGQNAAANRGK